MALRIEHLLLPPFRMGMDPGTVMSWVSDQLFDLDEQCATAIVLGIDLVGGGCHYVNTGHPIGMSFGRDGVRKLDGTEFGLERIQSIIEEFGPPVSPDVIAEALVGAVRQACETPLRY
jgi:hypothetical protein